MLSDISYRKACFQIFRFKGLLKAVHVVMQEGAHGLHSKKHGCYSFDGFSNLWLVVFVISIYICSVYIYTDSIYVYR